MTELQKVEFRILKEFLHVCSVLDLKYYLVCGSALGAVKFKGFIPWDDDIDVALPRADYDRFITEGQALLPEWCFMQNYISDPEFHLLGTKLRDSRTTYIEQMCDSLNINHGVFIDVFPLDEQWIGEKEYWRFKKYRKRFDAKRRIKLHYKRVSKENVFSFRANYYYFMNRFFGLYNDNASYIREFDEYVKSFNGLGSDVLCNHANSASCLEFADKNQYGQGEWAYFEGLRVRIPEKYDDYLTQKYGNWKDDLPVYEQKGHHYYSVCDLNNSYKKYGYK